MIVERSAAYGLLFVLALTACRAPPEAPVAEPTTGEADRARRERLREALRAQLGEAYDDALPAATASDLERGAKLYDAVCSSCHGRTGRGNGRSARLLAIRPPDLSDPTVAAFFSDRAKLHIVAEGLEGTPMIGWRAMLSDEERLDVLLYMRTFERGAATATETGS